MKANLFKFDIQDFNEIYTIIDADNQRLHISAVNYQFNMTLDLTKDLRLQIKELTKYGERNFNDRVQHVIEWIIAELKLS